MVLLGSTSVARAAQDDAVYGLANGCYAVDGQGSYRFKAVTLGRFMLLGKDNRLLHRRRHDRDARPGGGPDASTTSAATASRSTAASTRSPRPTAASAFPEAEINAEGPVYEGPTPYGETRGYIDAHMHMMAFHFLGGEVHCGEPWNAYGVTVALKGCDRLEVGSPVVEAVLSGEAATDPVGWPSFKQWPRWNALAHEQSYYKWLERSWRGGQRLFVNLFVENHALCSLYPHKTTGYNCNEMESVRRQARELRNLQDYVDAQYGGPGKGWFRIVSDPFQARRVINSGKMAIVPGIEVSDLFDCGLRNGVSNCTPRDRRQAARRGLQRPRRPPDGAHQQVQQRLRRRRRRRHDARRDRQRRQLRRDRALVGHEALQERPGELRPHAVRHRCAAVAGRRRAAAGPAARSTGPARTATRWA